MKIQPFNIKINLYSKRMNFRKTVTKHTNALYIKEITIKRLSPVCHQTITLFKERW